MSSPPVRRLLIVKLGAIGDVVMVIPAAYAMHREGYVVDWLCGQAVAPILGLYPWIHVIGIDERPLLRGSWSERLRAVLATRRLLRGRSYELCATLYYDSRYELLTRSVGAKRRLRLNAEDRATALLPGRHHTDEFARILLGHEDGELPQQLAPIAATGLPEPPLPQPDSSRPRIVLVPAGARNLLRDDALRRWPVEAYAEVAAELVQRRAEVVLAGGPEDGWASAAFAAVGVTDLIGRLSLVETVALLDSAEVTVTHDTGPLHLAGITSCGIVSIFGPTDPRGRLPQREDSIALWGGEGFACRPCYDGKEYAPCTHNGCVRQVTAAMVLQQVERLLAARRAGERLAPQVIVPEHTAVERLIGIEGVGR